MTAASARLTSFDLLGPEGWEMLTQDIPLDFPYLTLADINATMAMGRKGALDTGRAQPLNYTRIYKWVKDRAQFSLGYWQMKHPALLDWVDMAGLTAALLVELDAYETPAAAFAQPHKMRDLLQKVARRQYAPHIDFNSFTTHKLREEYPGEAAEMDFLEQVLHPQFLAKYPEQASQHTRLF